jgi:hypothetical protein
MLMIHAPCNFLESLFEVPGPRLLNAPAMQDSFSSKLKRGMRKALSGKKSSTAGSVVTAEPFEASRASVGSLNLKKQASGFDQVTPYFFT